MAALSGRPAPPKQVHRSALPGIVFLVVAFLLLGYSGSTKGTAARGTPELVLGIVALIPAIVLLAPFFLVGLGRLARHAPVAVRLALRDLARYRARSASALAAIGLGVMIAVIIATFAQARYSNIWDPAGPNLASNQANISMGVPYPTPKQVRAWAKVADRVGSGPRSAPESRRSSTVGGLQNSSGTKSLDGSLTVATPQLLRGLGIRPSQIQPERRRRDLAARFRRCVRRGAHLVREGRRDRSGRRRKLQLHENWSAETHGDPSAWRATDGRARTEHLDHRARDPRPRDHLRADRSADWVVCQRRSNRSLRRRSTMLRQSPRRRT